MDIFLVNQSCKLDVVDVEYKCHEEADACDSRRLRQWFPDVPGITILYAYIYTKLKLYVISR